MVSSTFNPLYAATAVMYQQQREQRASSMQPHYQQHVPMDYGNRAVQGALAYGSLFPASGTGSDPFYQVSDVNLCQQTGMYGYGQPQQPHPLAGSPFSSSPNPLGAFKCDGSFQPEPRHLEGQTSPDIRNGKEPAVEMASGLQPVTVGPDTTAIGGVKSSGLFSPTGQQPSATAATSPCPSFPPCRMFPPTGREIDMEADTRTSPSGYFYGTGRSTNAQSYYGITPPSTGFYFPGTNTAQSSVPFGSSQFGENAQLGPFAQEYPWMKSKFQNATAPYGSAMPPPPDAAMEIGRWCSPNAGRTRTREKYRMVYTDGQRLELEKEFITSEYISTQRKAYLSRALGLSERQIKIWFQNRRAKKRKQSRRSNVVNDPNAMAGQSHLQPMVSSTSDFRALASLSASDGEASRHHSLEDISASPDPFM